MKIPYQAHTRHLLQPTECFKVHRFHLNSTRLVVFTSPFCSRLLHGPSGPSSSCLFFRPRIVKWCNDRFFTLIPEMWCRISNTLPSSQFPFFQVEMENTKKPNRSDQIPISVNRDVAQISSKKYAHPPLQPQYQPSAERIGFKVLASFCLSNLFERKLMQQYLKLAPRHLIVECS